MLQAFLCTLGQYTNHIARGWWIAEEQSTQSHGLATELRPCASDGLVDRSVVGIVLISRESFLRQREPSTTKTHSDTQWREGEGQSSLEEIEEHAGNLRKSCLWYGANAQMTRGERIQRVHFKRQKAASQTV